MLDTEFWDWFNQGIHKGWITNPFCQTHDGGYDVMTEEEVTEWEDGGDPCMTVTRVTYLG
jgi:hypothetical protein